MSEQPTPTRSYPTMLGRLVLRWLITSLSLFAAINLVPGISFQGYGWEVGVLALVFLLVTMLVRPLLVLMSLPLLLLTLGLFTLVINAILLLLTSALADVLQIAFHIETFWSAIAGSFVMWLVSFLLNWAVGEHRIVIRRVED